MVVRGFCLAIVRLAQRRGAQLNRSILKELHRQRTYPFGITRPIKPWSGTLPQLFPERKENRGTEPQRHPYIRGEKRPCLGLVHPVGEPEGGVYDGGNAGS